MNKKPFLTTLLIPFFTAKFVNCYAKWQLNKDKASVEELFTNRQMVQSLFHTRCHIKLNIKNNIQKVQTYFETEVQVFARL